MNLFNDIQNLTERLNTNIRTLAQNGKAFAEAEHDYKICLREEALKLRQEKNMPVTLIQQIIYGVPEVAKKRFARDVAETMYNVNLESINSIKLQLRLLENQLQREWGNTK